MDTGSFPEVTYGRGVLLTTHPLLVPRSWKSRAIPLPTFWAKPGLYWDHFTFAFFIVMNIGLTKIIAGYVNSDLLRAIPLARSSHPCSPLPLSQLSFRVTTLKTQAAGLSAALLPVYKPMRQHILQNSEIHILCCENLKSAVNSTYFVLPNENFIIHI